MTFGEQATGEVSDLTIVGAGPAGITIGMGVISLSAAQGLRRPRVNLIDPTLTGVGGLQEYQHVPGNTGVGGYMEAIRACIGRYPDAIDTSDLPINNLPKNETCKIELLSQPLRYMANLLTQSTTNYQGYANRMTFADGVWQIDLDTSEETTPATVYSRVAVVTTGGRPKELDGLCVSDNTREKLIRLPDALDPERLREHTESRQSIGIIGSSHSGILALMNLLKLEQPPQCITVFHQSQIRLAVSGDPTKYDNTGLKGSVREWAKDNLLNTSEGSITYVGNDAGDTTVSFVRISEDSQLTELLEQDLQVDSIIDARGLRPTVRPYITFGQNTVSTAQIAKYGASTTYPRLFFGGALAPEKVQEITDHNYNGGDLFAGNVGVAKFIRDQKLPHQIMKAIFSS